MRRLRFPAQSNPGLHRCKEAHPQGYRARARHRMGTSVFDHLLEYVSMSPRKTALPLALAALLAGTAGMGIPVASDAAAQAATQAPQPPERHRFDPTRHIEGRIAFLKAELKITDAQAPQFDKVAQAMRDNAKIGRA